MLSVVKVRLLSHELVERGFKLTLNDGWREDDFIRLWASKALRGFRTVATGQQRKKLWQRVNRKLKKGTK